MNEITAESELEALRSRICELEKEIKDKNIKFEGLAEEYSLIRNILDLIAVPVIAVDRDYKLRFGNSRAWEMINLPKEVVDKISIWNSPTLPPDEKAKVKSIVERMLKGESRVVAELWSNTDSGKKLIRWTHDISRDKDGNMDFFTATGTDITDLWETSQELARAKEEAENATRNKDRYISILSHDLKAPLLSIGFLMKLLKEGISIPEEEIDSLLGKAITSSAGMVEMINTILDLGRLKEGRLHLNRSEVPTRKILDKIIRYFEEYSIYKGISIKNLLSETHTVYADQVLLEIVFRNLLSNAIKFSSRGSLVTIFSPEERNNYFAISNTGGEIKEEILGNLFENDILTSSPGTWEEVGSGFGLPLCREIMNRHSGEISVVSQRGVTEFSLYFPLEGR